MITAEHTHQKIFYGWWVVGAAGIGSFMSYGPIISVAVGFLAGAALGVFLVWSEAIGGLAFAAAILIGFGVGAETDLMPYVVLSAFMGANVTAAVLMARLGPYRFGELAVEAI